MLSQTKGPYPQVLKPSTGGYWVEGFVEKRQSDSDNMLRTAQLDSTSYELLKNDAINYYKLHFQGQVGTRYIRNLSTFVISLSATIYS